MVVAIVSALLRSLAAAGQPPGGTFPIAITHQPDAASPNSRPG